MIPTTILLTLFASKLMGYTINRVSLFALIFSIGILVDDAIVMIENIARHWAMDDGTGPRRRGGRGGGRGRQSDRRRDPDRGRGPAADDVRLRADGPLHGPIPVNASAAMVFSFFVAVVIAPWLMVRFARPTISSAQPARQRMTHTRRPLGRLYLAVAAAADRQAGAAPGLPDRGRAATMVACVMFATKDVTVKLLPFDNKSELQVVLNMPRGNLAGGHPARC